MAQKKMAMMASCSPPADLHKAASKSSTKSQALCGNLASRPCIRRNIKAPVRCHQKAEKRPPKWQTR